MTVLPYPYLAGVDIRHVLVYNNIIIFVVTESSYKRNDVMAEQLYLILNSFNDWASFTSNHLTVTVYSEASLCWRQPLYSSSENASTTTLFWLKLLVIFLRSARENGWHNSSITLGYFLWDELVCFLPLKPKHLRNIVPIYNSCWLNYLSLTKNIHLYSSTPLQFIIAKPVFSFCFIYLFTRFLGKASPPWDCFRIPTVTL